MEISKVFNNNRTWIAEKLKGDETYFEQMAKGQSPEMLYIGCSDSRVTAEELMGLGPGKVFVHRNIANLIPNNDLSAQSVINYAVVQLKVRHLVVCGHYNCGGVKAAMAPADLGPINPWLRNIRDVYRLHQAELDGIADDGERYNRLVELNVYEQCINALKSVEVQQAYQIGELSIHGWVFDLATGQLIDLQIDVDAIIEAVGDVIKLVDNIRRPSQNYSRG